MKAKYPLSEPPVFRKQFLAQIRAINKFSEGSIRKSSKSFVRPVIALCLFFILHAKLNAAATVDRAYLSYVKEIVDSFASEMEQENDVECVGDGGSMPNDVQEIEVFFTANRRGLIDESRKIEVNGVQKLLNKINSHEKLRKYLAVYPFSPNRVNVAVSFRNKNNDYYYDGSVSYVSFINGIIYYTSAEMVKKMSIPFSDCRDPNNIIRYPQEEIVEQTLVDILDESLEEAIKMMN